MENPKEESKPYDSEMKVDWSKFKKEEAKQETLTYTEASKKEERIFNSTMVSKQETLEEETLSKIKFVLLANNDAQAIRILEQYGEFQKEGKYNEEEVQHILIEYVKTNPTKPYRVVKWFEQFKKK
jgi:hypothetical protein